MKPAPLLLVPFREVRHDQPDDCLHYEAVSVRGEEMNWTIPAHRHEGLHQFQMLARGTVRGTIDGQPFDCVAPAWLMLAPGSVHGFTYSHDVIGHQVTLPTATLRGLLGGSALAETALGASFIASGPVAAGGAEESVRTFEAVAREFGSDLPGRVHSLLAHATLLAVQFLRQRGEAHAGDKPRGARDTLVQRYRSLVEQHYRRHQALTFYAEALGVSADHLSRTCRHVAGQSAHELLHERVMLEARRLLAYSAAPVAEIATQLGYADPAYFSKFFARCVGETPSGYRALVARGVTASPQQGDATPAQR
jgi:AraC family transcriptional activator of pobA